MSVNVKLGDDIINGVSSVKLKSATTPGAYETFVLSSAPASSNDVNFLDYDGTIVRSYSAADFANLSAMPDNPTHEGLTAQGWNWTLSDAKAYVAANGMLDIGQMYITDDGKTRLYISIVGEVRMTVPLYWAQTVANGVTIDWGDNSAPETFSGTGAKNTTHTYAAIGDYVITLNPVEGCTLGIGNGYSGSGPVLGAGDTYAGGSYVYPNMLKKVEIGKQATLSSYAVRYYHSLKTITIPNAPMGSGWNVFDYCTALDCIIVPMSATSLVELPNIGLKRIAFSNGSFNVKCVSGNLERVAIPSNASLSAGAFSGCSVLGRVAIPNGITSIPSQAFSQCQCLTSMVIPSSISTIGSMAFQGCNGIKKFDFSACTAVPTLENANAFNWTANDAQILVPSSLYEDWKAATNWSTLASKIVSA